jgi:hypothetical protein
VFALFIASLSARPFGSLEDSSSSFARWLTIDRLAPLQRTATAKIAFCGFHNHPTDLPYLWQRLSPEGPSSPAAAQQVRFLLSTRGPPWDATAIGAFGNCWPESTPTHSILGDARELITRHCRRPARLHHATSGFVLRFSLRVMMKHFDVFAEAYCRAHASRAASGIQSSNWRTSTSTNGEILMTGVQVGSGEPLGFRCTQ